MPRKRMERFTASGWHSSQVAFLETVEHHDSNGTPLNNDRPCRQAVAEPHFGDDRKGPYVVIDMAHGRARFKAVSDRSHVFKTASPSHCPHTRSTSAPYASSFFAPMPLMPCKSPTVRGHSCAIAANVAS